MKICTCYAPRIAYKESKAYCTVCNCWWAPEHGSYDPPKKTLAHAIKDALRDWETTTD